MKRFAITGDFDPREAIKGWKWTPEVKQYGWKCKDRTKDEMYDLKYIDIFWLGLQISIDNERN